MQGHYIKMDNGTMIIFVSSIRYRENEKVEDNFKDAWSMEGVYICSVSNCSKTFRIEILLPYLNTSRHIF